MPGAKKKNGARYREGMTLLEMDSDSDGQVEHFSLDSMKTPMVNRRKRNECCCTRDLIIMLFFMGFVIAAIFILGLQYTNLKQRVLELEQNNSSKSVQSSNQGTPEEISSLQTQLARISQTIQDLQSKEDGYEQSISDQANQISELKDDVSKVEKDVNEKAPPSDLARIKQEQAKFGSELDTIRDDVNNLKNFQTDINDRFTELQKQLEQLVSAGSANSPSTGSMAFSNVVQKMTELENSIDSVNVSLSARLLQVAETGRQNQGDVQTLTERADQLDNEIMLLKVSAASTPSQESPEHSTTPTLNSAAVESLIQNALQNYSLNGNSADLQAYNASVQTQISGVLARLNVVEGKDLVSGSVFLQSKNNFQAQFQNVNQSVSQLKTSTNELRSLVEEHHTRLAAIDSRLANTVSDETENPSSSGDQAQPAETNPSEENDGDALHDNEGEPGPVEDGQGAEGTTKKMLIGGDDGHLPTSVQLTTTQQTTTVEDWSMGVMFKDGVTTSEASPTIRGLPSGIEEGPADEEGFRRQVRRARQQLADEKDRR